MQEWEELAKEHLHEARELDELTREELKAADCNLVALLELVVETLQEDSAGGGCRNRQAGVT